MLRYGLLKTSKKYVITSRCIHRVCKKWKAILQSSPCNRELLLRIPCCPHAPRETYEYPYRWWASVPDWQESTIASNSVKETTRKAIFIHDPSQYRYELEGWFHEDETIYGRMFEKIHWENVRTVTLIDMPLHVHVPRREEESFSFIPFDLYTMDHHGPMDKVKLINCHIDVTAWIFSLLPAEEKKLYSRKVWPRQEGFKISYAVLTKEEDFELSGAWEVIRRTLEPLTDLQEHRIQRQLWPQAKNQSHRLRLDISQALSRAVLKQ